MVDIDWRLESNGAYWTFAYKDAAGVWRRKSIGSKERVGNRRAAERECKRLAAEMAREPSRREVGKAPTLKAWQETYLQLREGELDDRTIDLYRNTFDYLMKFREFGPDIRLDRITPAAADDWRAWLQNQPVRYGRGQGGERKLSDETVCSHVSRAKNIFARAVKRRHIVFNPFAEVNCSPAAKPKRWAEITRDDLAKILDACPDAGWRALFALCRYAGLRRGEALALQWTDIDWVARFIRVPNPNPSGKETTKKHLRDVPMEPDLYAVLKECQDQAPGPERADYDPRVCPIDKVVGIERDAKAIIAAAGVGVYAKPFHTLRKNLESEWLSKYPVMDVCCWLGHSPVVAARHYQKPTAETIAKVTGAAGEPANA
ncbi:tyrosine-type recombinase/integrase [uncultured Thermomonospora sp.]|uniref:tyrosine-type recombinase/integrase n=1 Tax=uncultured Thermomonospora sp. TaxID=671175 RepID=UPI00259BE7CD|nr:tyrosine-type recombinase/integrase [uncultured Thermomonospora sp.]